EKKYTRAKDLLLANLKERKKPDVACAAIYAELSLISRDMGNKLEQKEYEKKAWAQFKGATLADLNSKSIAWQDDSEGRTFQWAFQGLSDRLHPISTSPYLCLCTHKYQDDWSRAYEFARNLLRIEIASTDPVDLSSAIRQRDNLVQVLRYHAVSTAEDGH